MFHCTGSKPCGGDSWEHVIELELATDYFEQPQHPEHRQFLDWLPNGTFDPDEFDPERVKLLLRSIRV